MEVRDPVDDVDAVGADAAVASGLPETTLAGLGNESFYLGFFTPPLASSIVL